LFEALIPCFWALGVDHIDPQYRGKFGEEDVGWLVGAGGDNFQTFAKIVLAILEPRPGESATLNGTTIARIEQLGRNCLRRRSDMFPGNMSGSFVRKYDDKFIRVEGKDERNDGQKSWAIRCDECGSWYRDGLNTCTVCGYCNIPEQKKINGVHISNRALSETRNGGHLEIVAFEYDF
jgi:ribosomal protein L37E